MRAAFAIYCCVVGGGGGDDGVDCIGKFTNAHTILGKMRRRAFSMRKGYETEQTHSLKWTHAEHTEMGKL